MLGLGRILISDLVVANLLMYSLPLMILLYLAAPFFTPKVFLGEITITYTHNICIHSYCVHVFLLGVCPVKGQTQRNCTTCPTTCITRLQYKTPCPLVCHNESTCECPLGTVIDEDRNECVSPDECPESMTTAHSYTHTYTRTHNTTHTSTHTRVQSHIHREGITLFNNASAKANSFVNIIYIMELVTYLLIINVCTYS